MLKLVSGHAIASSGVGSFPASCPQDLARACVFFLLTGQRVIASDSRNSCGFDSFQYCDHLFAENSVGGSAVSTRVSGTDCASVFVSTHRTVVWEKRCKAERDTTKEQSLASLFSP